VTRDQAAPIEPSKHSTDEVDVFRRNVESIIDVTKGAGSQEIRPDKDVRKYGRPCNYMPKAATRLVALGP
jgi:hypothetical protein